MISRELKEVLVRSYSDAVDSYGQKHTTVSSTTTELMYIKEYTHTATSDIRYSQADFIGLTKNYSINDTNDVVVDGKTYKIIYALATPRYNLLYLQEVK